MKYTKRYFNHGDHSLRPLRINNCYSFEEFEEAYSEMNEESGIRYTVGLLIELEESMIGGEVAKRVRIYLYNCSDGSERWILSVDGKSYDHNQEFFDAIYNVVKEIDGQVVKDGM